MASSWAQLGSVFERPIDMAALLKANDITVDVSRVTDVLHHLPVFFMN